MTRHLGPLQQQLLHALRRHGREATLVSLAALAAGLVSDLQARLPLDRAPSRAQYSSTARAISALRRRGLVTTLTAGIAKGRIEWCSGDRWPPSPLWRFRNPSTRTLVRAVPVETLASDLWL
jgi:hypothetical protein